MQDTAENPLPKYFYALSPLSSSPEKKKKRRPATEDQAAFRDDLQIILFWYTVLATCPPVQRGITNRQWSVEWQKLITRKENVKEDDDITDLQLFWWSRLQKG